MFLLPAAAIFVLSSDWWNWMYLHKGNDSIGDGSPDGQDAAQLVELCAAQIQAALTEASKEISELSVSVLDTARYASELLRDVRRETEARQPPAGTGASVDDSKSLQQAVNNASSRLQFADRLTQRMSNVSSNLTALADLMKSSDQPVTRELWSAFLLEARGRFTMEQERMMFDAMFGTSIAEQSEQVASDVSDDQIFFDTGVPGGQ